MPVNERIESGKSFFERAGAPAEFPTALGLVVLAFADLERALACSIMSQPGAGEVPAEVVAAELSFAQRVHLLSSLLRIALAAELGLYAYDAYMLGLARSRRLPLVTLDGKLGAAARAIGVELVEI